MKKFTFLTFVLAFIASILHAQDLPAFVPPVRNEPNTNRVPASELLQVVRSIVSASVPLIQTNNVVSAVVVSAQGPRTNVYDRLGMSWPTETNAAPVLSLQSQEEKEKREKSEKVTRLLALNEQVQAERRSVTNAVATTNHSVVTKIGLTPTTNVTVKVAKSKKADKNSPPPLFVAPGSATNYVAPQKPAEVFVYKQQVWYPTNEAQVAMREHSIARLEGKEGSVWNTGGTQPTQPAGGTQNYAVDQRPLDQGTQPTPVAHYATHQGSYATAPATYAVQSSYPVYAEGWSYYPVAHYPTHGYSYPSYGYEYPSYGYGVGYVSQRRLFGVSFDAVIAPSYNYSPGWSVRGGGHSHQTRHHHQINYPTYGERRGRGR